MEEVLVQLSGARLSEPTPGSGYDMLFKNRSRQGSQDERRRWILESQKRQRNDKLDHTRGILDLVDAVETEMEWSGADSGVRYKRSHHVAGFHRVSASYRDTLMLSEWMVERPEDFSDNWYLVPCPKGVRVLLVSSSGHTKCFTKYGQFLLEGRSALPGGSPSSAAGQSRCVLDCIWQKERNTLHVLDLLAWNNQPMTDCELEFRHFWLTSKLAECPGLGVVSKGNEFVFSLLPKVPCSPQPLNQFLMTHPAFPGDCPALDGLLFYHKRAHYTGGSTPLVGWLLPFMAAEVLGADVTVHPGYEASRPPQYGGQADFIAKFEQQQHSRRRRARPAACAGAGDTSGGDEHAVETATFHEVPDGEKSASRKVPLTNERVEEVPETTCDGDMETEIIENAKEKSEHVAFGHSPNRDTQSSDDMR